MRREGFEPPPRKGPVSKTGVSAVPPAAHLKIGRQGETRTHNEPRFKCGAYASSATSRKLVARVRIELTSHRLRGGYSAVELAGKINLVRHLGLEPRRRLRHGVLNPTCLPFHQQREIGAECDNRNRVCTLATCRLTTRRIPQNESLCQPRSWLLSRAFRSRAVLRPE